MGRHPSIMVPIALLLVLPLVAATGYDMQDMMKMMEMMEMMNKMKGWGDKSMEMGSMEDSKEEDSREMMGGQQGGEWFNMQNREDYEAYLKWCEENRARNAEFQEQQRLLDQFKQRGDPNSIAQVLVNMSKGDQIKAFFAGLKEAMCDGAEAYVEQVEAWEKQFKFLERLM